MASKQFIPFEVQVYKKRPKIIINFRADTLKAINIVNGKAEVETIHGVKFKTTHSKNEALKKVKTKPKSNKPEDKDIFLIDLEDLSSRKERLQKIKEELGIV